MTTTPPPSPLRRLAFALLAVGGLLVWSGCRADTSGLSTLSVDELASMRTSGSGVGVRVVSVIGA